MENKVVYDSSMTMANESMNFISRILAALIKLFEKQSKTEQEKDIVNVFKEHKGNFLTFPANDNFMGLANKEGLLCIRFQNEGKDYVLFRDSDLDIAQKCANECRYNDLDLELSPTEFINTANDEPLIVVEGFKTVDEINQFREDVKNMSKEDRFSFTSIYYGDGFAIIAYKKDTSKITDLINEQYSVHDLSDKDYNNISVESIDRKIEKADKEIKSTAKEQTKSKDIER